MELRMVDGRASPKRDFRSLRGRNPRTLRSNLCEFIARAKGGSVVAHTPDQDGVVRMKLIVRKQDLKQVLEIVKTGKTDMMTHDHQSPSSSAEHRLNLLRKRNLLRTNAARQLRWTPALESIREEL